MRILHGYGPAHKSHTYDFCKGVSAQKSHNYDFCTGCFVAVLGGAGRSRIPVRGGVGRRWAAPASTEAHCKGEVEDGPWRHPTWPCAPNLGHLEGGRSPGPTSTVHAKGHEKVPGLLSRQHGPQRVPHRPPHSCGSASCPIAAYGCLRSDRLSQAGVRSPSS